MGRLVFFCVSVLHFGSPCIGQVLNKWKTKLLLLIVDERLNAQYTLQLRRRLLFALLTNAARKVIIKKNDMEHAMEHDMERGIWSMV